MIESYPFVATDGQWTRLESVASPENEMSFLYIGPVAETKFSFSKYFQTGAYAENFGHAEHVIETLGWKNLPDVIFIDVPLNRSTLQKFKFFLLSRNLDNKTVVIYNDNKLDAGGVRMLKQFELVDDVIDINSQVINYSSKVIFLKKIKSRRPNLSISWHALKVQSLGVQSSSFIKRSIDVALAAIAILLLLPVFLLIAIAIRIQSKGPVFYSSLRAGQGFKIFKFYKFRTMIIDAEKKIDSLAHLNQYGNEGKMVFLKITNDPRVTKIGKFLRNTSLDELPQLFNVLKGDMSLVGNRPLPLYEASCLTTNEFVERFVAPAGITGLWQIKKRGQSQMSVEERINLDISYARKSSLIYDFWIMAKTPTALFQKNNV